MNKLYILHVVKDESSWAEELACSNDIRKLESITFTEANCWTINSSPSDNEVRFTEKGTYPYYTISEFPYVC